jgi:copper(I)-binding protein
MTMSRTPLSLSTHLATLVATLLVSSLPLSAMAAPSELVIDDPYVRLAPPNAPASGAFMLIKNTANTDRKLLRAESPAAKIVELHTHINDNGVMKMREVPQIEIKAHGQTELKPGSYHVMLINLTQPLKEGDMVPISLKFDDGSVQQISAPVRRTQPAMPAASPTASPAEKPMQHGGMKH